MMPLIANSHMKTKCILMPSAKRNGMLSALLNESGKNFKTVLSPQPNLYTSLAQ